MGKPMSKARLIYNVITIGFLATCAVVAVCGSLVKFFFFMDNDSGTPSYESQSTQVVVSGNTPEFLTAEFRNKVKTALGDDVKEFKINDYIDNPSQKVIQVHWLIGDNLTDGMINRGAMIDVEKILKAVDASGINCYEVTVIGHFPMQDSYGNVSEKMVIKATYSKQVINKINWSNFLTTDVFKIASDKWFHPDFR